MRTWIAKLLKIQERKFAARRGSDASFSSALLRYDAKSESDSPHLGDGFYAPRCAPGQTKAVVNVSTPDNLARLRTSCERAAKDISNTF